MKALVSGLEWKEGNVRMVAGGYVWHWLSQHLKNQLISSLEQGPTRHPSAMEQGWSRIISISLPPIAPDLKFSQMLLNW